MKARATKKVAIDNAGHSVKVTTTLEAPHSDIDPAFEKPLLEVKVSNPFKKILYWLDQIRKHQTTTLAVKLSVPLIAFPIILAGAFSLGRVTGLGLIGSTVQTASPIPTPVDAPKEVEVSKAGILKIAKSPTRTTHLLSLRNGELVTLNVPDTINLSKYANRQILVSGTINKQNNVLTVTDIAEVSIYNSIQILESTESANLP